jgi:MFS family permease
MVQYRHCYCHACRGAFVTYPLLSLLLLLQLVGPILGPILGGALSQAFSWRSTFIMVVMYAGVVILPMVCFMKETHQYKKVGHVLCLGDGVTCLAAACRGCFFNV